MTDLEKHSLLPVPWLPDIEPIASRALSLGGTDVAGLMGLCNSEWSNPYSIYLEKTGKSEPKADAYRLKRGRALEPLVCAEYCERTKQIVVQPRTAYRSRINLFHGGSPDGLVEDRRVVAEFKTLVGFYDKDAWGPDGSDIIPLNYRCQLLWYLMLCDADYGELMADLNGNLRLYQIGRHQPTEDRLLEEAEDFWTRHILADIPPEITYSEAAENYIKSKYPRNLTALREATPQEEELMVRLSNLTRQLEAAKEEDEALKLQLKAMIGDAAGLESEAVGRITYRSAKDGTETDWRAVALHLCPSPELVSKFTETKEGSRRFLKNFKK